MKDVKGKEMEQERKGTISNEDIDLARTKYNLDLVESDQTLYQRVKERVEELKANGSRVQTNSVVMYSNILTVSEEQAIIWGEEKTEAYFKACYDFFCDEFGKDNVVSAKIHKDETTPHMHLHFVPVNKENGKLQARVSMNKAKINYIHDALPQFLQARGFDVVRASGKTKEKNIDNIHEFKQVKRQLAAQQVALDTLEQKVKVKQALVSDFPDIPHMKSKKETKIERVKVGFFKVEEQKVPTGNRVIREEDFHLAIAALRMKATYERLLQTDFVQENQHLHTQYQSLANAYEDVKEKYEHKARAYDELSNENRQLTRNIQQLRAEIREIYQATKTFLKTRTSDVSAFKAVFTSWIEKVREHAPNGELARLNKRERSKAHEQER